MCRGLSICIVSHNAYGAMTGGRSGHIGGVEWQTSLMAKWLAARGYRVSIVTWDEGQQDGVETDGVQMLKVCRRDEGAPVIRFVHPRWTSLYKALRRAGAHLYYQNTAECVTGQVGLWCRLHGRRFVFSTASDSDVHPALPALSHFRERVLYGWGLRCADRIIVQTRVQQEQLRRHFHRKSVVLPMPCPGPDAGSLVERSLPGGRPRMLWVGHVREVKRLEWLLDVAETCPDLQFDVVGPASDNEHSRQVCERGRQIPNVVMHGAVSRDAMPAHYRNASLLCCTSRHEGFPNTFLEAWSYGLPVVSTFDPDRLVAERNLGVIARDVTGLINGIRMLIGTPSLWVEASHNARQYYLENHTVDAVMTRFEALFLDSLGRLETSDVSGSRRIQHQCCDSRDHQDGYR